MLLVRAAQTQDAELIGEYNRRLALETEGKHLDWTRLRPGVQAVLADPTKGRYFVADIEGKMVGQLMITFEWSDWRNGFFWWIQSVYVAPEARRHGVFRALYDFVHRLANNDPNVIGIRLYVEHANKLAQSTYEKLGMTYAGYEVMEQSLVAEVGSAGTQDSKNGS